MACYVVIRRARPEDEAARTALLRDAAHEHFLDAFLMFFFHELTLQCVVLGGAVLFIFVGGGAGACAALVPAAALLVASAVGGAHALHAGRQARALRRELAGWVAEAHGAPRDLAAPPRAPPVHSEARARRLGLHGARPALAARVVGTVSLSEWRGAEARGWLHALGVARAWRRRGAARALAGAAGAACAAAGLQSAEARCSGVQTAARAALHAAGWSLRASYSRPLLGAALTLPMVHLGKDFSVA